MQAYLTNNGYNIIVEQSLNSSTPLDLSATEGMGVKTITFYKHLAAKLRAGMGNSIQLLLVEVPPELLTYQVCHPNTKRCQILPEHVVQLPISVDLISTEANICQD